ncbi:MAG: valine--tRNA ligase [Calditrichaeota bacterium]|nr:MAG: valine--tRNA ligase [Calditrichota bacterium]MBL1205977.1 valine--tRNA ligase [Calditrichota bacterium]NOG45805.1 valine--tRNA ligase [Calditrichota bacterium]
MSKETAKIYDPKNVENKWYDKWVEKNYFSADSKSEKPPYTIVIPPPNVTARLHMGHAFNNAIQDILIRYKRKTGFEALWLPGTDHAGIATQAVVERDLKESENKSRHDLGREKFVERVWKWKEEHSDIINDQLKKIGCSLDWQRERFTMDEGLSHAVMDVFEKFYERGLIYKGQRIVNWDPASGTALSDDEVDHKEINGKMYHIRYKYEGSDEYIVVATTRPETLLGDTGVAISPDDDEKKHLIGKKVIIPFVNRAVAIFADEHVDKEFGSGFVKATPAHDPNDFEMGQRHNLDEVIMLDKDGTIFPVCQKVTENGLIDELPVPQSLAGLERFAARKKIVAELKEMGQLEKVEDHVHAVGHSYRSHVPVEPYLSEQWFVKMKPLAEKALQAVENGDVKFYPPGKFENTYRHWMNNIRDWCISRQLWWGHRIPVWYNDKGAYQVSKTDPSTSIEKWVQDEDVLDTWFSSQLWPFSTLGWPDSADDLNNFYPTSTLVTGPDIIFFWVARMIMAGLEFMDNKPFDSVFFNGIVRDEKGRKMSKSLGNGIDPLEMVDLYSADAVRFTLIMMSAEGQDLNVGEKSFETGRNFSNKVWNAFRFLTMNLEDYSTDFEPYKNNFELADRWILSRYNSAIENVVKNLDQFRFHDALEAVYHFFWGDYCDWYLEVIKPRLYKPEKPEDKQTALRLASFIMKGSMELLHPFVPFITEEIWQNFKSGDEESIVISQWEKPRDSWDDSQAENDFTFLQDSISALRNMRSEMDVPPGKSMDLVVECEEATFEMIAKNIIYFKSLAKVETILKPEKTFDKKDAATVVVKGCEYFVPLSDLIDREKEKARLEKELKNLQGMEMAIRKKLENKNFVERAPKAVVEGEQNKLANIQENLVKVEANYEKYL